MRAGYLTALAARTLGAAPLLQPATPSLYEPDGPQAELREITGVIEAEAGRPAAPPRGPALAGEGAADAVPHRRGLAEPVFPDDQPRAPRVLPGIVAAAAGPDGAARDRQGDVLPPLSAGTVTGHETMTGAAAPAPPVPGPLPADSLADPVSPPTRPSADQATWIVDMAQVSRSRQQAAAGRAAERGAERAEAPAAEPAIVVRIGRVDVRAVQAAPAPAPAPRPRPAAGPSLAEHLRARDRGRR